MNNEIKLINIVKNIINNWPNWKKQHYNNYFAVSSYAKKLKIK